MPLFAVTCGAHVTGNFVLTSDLICSGAYGLIVGDSNTTINLNGHTITCTGAEECGPLPNSNLFTLVSYGIMSDAYDNVKILGPGKIVGFTYAIQISRGKGHVVSDVDLSGAGRIGIQISHLSTPDCGQGAVSIFNPPAPTFLLSNNRISWKWHGIDLKSSHCGVIKSNVLADNSLPFGSAPDYGIVVEGNSNQLVQNTIAHNGHSDVAGGGADIAGDGNRVTGNYVTANAGYGIGISGSSNMITANTSRFNGTADMADYLPLMPYNSWNTNNTCNTQQWVKVVICGPNEN